MTLDNPLWGVLIGASIPGALEIIKLIADAWKRSHEDHQEKIKWQRHRQTADQETIREIYRDALHHLATFTASAEPGANSLKDLKPDSKAYDVYQHAQRALAMLSLRHPSTELDQVITLFTRNPFHFAERAHDYVMAMIAAEPHLFAVQPLKKVSIAKHEELPPGTFKFQFQTHPDYRREQLIEGTIVQSGSNFDCTLNTLTLSQRQLVVRHYFEHGILPLRIQLNLPVYNPNVKKILVHTPWMARLDPSKCTPLDILTHWERDFAEAMETALAAERDAQSPPAT